MSRLGFTFPCLDNDLAGTLDIAAGTTGLLIVSGGSEIRAGAFSGHAQIAAKIAKAGFPVFRFDRCGIGDSGGDDQGFRKSQPDIIAAVNAFKALAPKVERVIGFGNCDAASALMLGSGAACDGLILSNPWTIEGDDEAPPPVAVRSRYSEKLRNPKELIRLLTGKVDYKKLVRGIRSAMMPQPTPTTLAREMADGLQKFTGPAKILLAEKDRTAQIFDAAWDKEFQNISRCPNAGHSYAEPHAREWLYNQLLSQLRA